MARLVSRAVVGDVAGEEAVRRRIWALTLLSRLRLHRILVCACSISKQQTRISSLISPLTAQLPSLAALIAFRALYRCRSFLAPRRRPSARCAERLGSSVSACSHLAWALESLSHSGFCFLLEAMPPPGPSPTRRVHFFSKASSPLLQCAGLSSILHVSLPRAELHDAPRQRQTNALC